MRVLASRFVPDGPYWIDLATGSRVRIRLAESGTRRAQLEWSERCERQLRLRHPLLNPLLDFGAADAMRVFESYAVLPPIVGSGAAGLRLVHHGVRFLSSQLVRLTRDVAHAAVRQVTLGPYGRGRPLGVIVQPRPILERIGDLLAAGSPVGSWAVTMHCPPGSGTTTLRLSIARMARQAGYAPVCAAVLARYPGLFEVLRGRHLAVLLTGDESPPARDALIRLLAAAGAASSRRHVILAVRRNGLARPGELPVERLGAAAMNAMIFRDGEHGPTGAEIARAIEIAEGLPAALVRQLRGLGGRTTETGAMAVHETAPAYGPKGDEQPRPRRRIGRALERAEHRGRTLAASGRHAAAIRLLTRAVRVLEGRGERQATALCRCALGWILRDRGRSVAARAQFEAAVALSPESAGGIAASIALGVLEADDGRYAASEARLRAALVSARVRGDEATGGDASEALARTLLLAGRPGEALGLLAEQDNRPAAAALAGRVYAALGDPPRSLEVAARAVALAREDANVRNQMRAARALVAARLSAGDRPGAREAAAAALADPGTSRYPLARLRLRAALLAACSGDEARHLARRLRLAATRLALPVHLRADIERACEARLADRALVAAIGPSSAALREFLELAHSATDDRAAGEAICDRLMHVLAAAGVQIVTADAGRTVLLRAGRPWQSPEALIVSILAGGAAVGPSNPVDPYCAAEPVKYGPEVIAAMICRWMPGVPPDAAFATAMLGAGALAVATTVRALLDRTTHAAPVEAAWSELLGSSTGTVALRDAITRAARAPFPVLIEGESGSGKELVARAIHRLGGRRDRRLCTINCAAISDDLLEAELFGHARGAFTGAHTERAGLFEEADGGTLFLDEVGELTPRAQAKLLRVLQDGEVRRVGENLPRRVDTRVIAATNRSLLDDVSAGRFRADLRFRLDVIRIAVPSLRERAGDIPALAQHFWAEASARVGSRATLAPETLGALARYDWPGNVRELQNAMAAIAVQAPRRGRVTPALLPVALARATVPPEATFDAAREDFERRFVRAALARAGGHRGRAARALGMTRQGFSKMIRRLQLDV